jgi:hypothetical protein
MIKWSKEGELLTGGVLPLATLERPVDLDRVSHPVRKEDRKRLKMIVVRGFFAGWAVSELQESLHRLCHVTWIISSKGCKSKDSSEMMDEQIGTE